VPTTTLTQASPSIMQIALTDLRLPAKQPRRSMDPQKLAQLTESIRHYGVLEPLIVRPTQNDGLYELVAGERRYQAAKAAGLTQVPVSIHKFTDRQALEIALLENLQRDDLNAVDETEGILELLCQSLDASQKEVIDLMNRAETAKRRGKPLSDNDIRQIADMDKLFETVGRVGREGFRVNRLPLLKLPEDVLVFLRSGQLEYTKARLIAKVSDLATRQMLMQQTFDYKLSLSELKAKILAMDSTDSTEVGQLKDLRAEFRQLLRPQSEAWMDSRKRAKLEKVMKELQQILGS
jgi:ParB family transcriptional regulator, chromosome partitioning protein